MSGFALFTSLKLCARYIMYMYILVHAALQAPCRSAGSFRFLIALIDSAILTQSGKSNHSACSPARHPSKSPLYPPEQFAIRAHRTSSLFVPTRPVRYSYPPDQFVICTHRTSSLFVPTRPVRYSYPPEQFAIRTHQTSSLFVPTRPLRYSYPPDRPTSLLFILTRQHSILTVAMALHYPGQKKKNHAVDA